MVEIGHLPGVNREEEVQNAVELPAQGNFLHKEPFIFWGRRKRSKVSPKRQQRLEKETQK